MNDHHDEKMHELLKQSLGQPNLGQPNLGQPNPELDRDLWPQMLNRLGERSARVPWFDWALLALVALGMLLVPNTIPLLLYHL